MDKHTASGGGGLDGDDQSEDGQLRSPYNNNDENDDDVEAAHDRCVLILYIIVFCRVFIHFIFNIA